MPMKKIAALLSLSMLSACVYAGDMDIWPERNKVFTVWQTEKIFYYDKGFEDEYLSGSKTITENNLEKDQVQVTAKGGIMASSETRRTDFYTTETLKINKNGAMSSSYSPLYLKKNQTYSAFGEVTLKGEKYMLVHPGKSKDVLLVNGDGEIFQHLGRIVDDRLAVLDITFFVEPEDVRLTPVVNTRSETSEVLEGFELIFDGLSDNTLHFTYNTFGDEPISEEYIFPAEEENIEIKDIKINVISADYNKIEYVIL